MTETMPEPYDIAIARRSLAERKLQLKIAEGWSSLMLMYQAEIDEIQSFLTDWENGQISE